MKYIKSFGSIQYRKGDYVLLKYPENWRLYPYVKILQKKGDSYRIEAFKSNNMQLYETWLQYYDIFRKLKKDEIEDFESKKRAIDFNL